MSVVEGSGPFTCTNASHKGQPYSTTNLDEFNKHLATPGHKPYGQKPCSICGTIVKFQNQEAAQVKGVLCDKCKAEQGVPVATPQAQAQAQAQAQPGAAK